MITPARAEAGRGLVCLVWTDGAGRLARSGSKKLGWWGQIKETGLEGGEGNSREWYLSNAIKG